MTLKIDIRTVEHAVFIMHIHDFRKRAAEDYYKPDMRKSWSDIADLLEQAAVMSVPELEAFQDTLPDNEGLGIGSFARSRAANIIDEYLDRIEGISPKFRRPFLAA
ncbi:hypothetical protein [Devosia salina]|uniref:Uncharacterized protein n=1 Tax=Devosia salina TaxID=2860336 RepID=A0ABX8WC17_9HYPH|nr:hypothetical protein [Devosia salina]QYO75675.1 hypothetical protein K1X15_13660 [Devosia salina]